MIRCLAARPLPFGAQLGCIGSWRNKNLINFTKICNRNGSSMSVPPKDFRLDEFCLRQFNDENYSGTRVTGISPSEFLATVNDAYRAKPTLKEGYAPFCKHFFMPNFLVSMKVGDMPITEENRALLRVGYKARTEKELPVLSSWFPVDSVTPPEATYLDVILYSKDQIIKENKAMGTDHPPGEDEDYEWGIISVKGQLVDFEIPMQPITVMRNALGKEEGGSGVPLEREKYLASVAYWRGHASISS